MIRVYLMKIHFEEIDHLIQGQLILGEFSKSSLSLSRFSSDETQVMLLMLISMFSFLPLIDL